MIIRETQIRSFLGFGSSITSAETESSLLGDEADAIMRDMVYIR